MMFNQGILKRKLQREANAGQSIGFQRTLQVTQDMIHRLGLEKELEGHQGCVNCLEWNEKGTLLASGSDDVQIIVWNPFRHKRLTTIRTGHQGNIFSLKFLPNSNDSIIVSGAADCKIRVHDVNIQDTTHVFGCHAGRVKRLATAPNVPFMFWSAAEDGTIMQFDLRTPETSTPRNVLINLNAHMGLQAEAKCIAINPLRPDEMAVGANDPYVRVYDRRMLSCKSIKFPTDNGTRLQWDIPVIHPILKEEDYSLHAGCVQYFVAGHLPQKQTDYRKRYRTLASTYVTYSPDGSELLVNLGGEQIYLFDVNKKRSPQKFDMSLVLGKSTNGIVKEAAFSSNGFSFPHRTGTNGVRPPFVPKPNCPTSSTSSWPTSLQTEDESEKYKNRNGRRPKRDSKHLSPPVEALKRKANSYFEKNQCTKAIILYNQAITMMPHASVLYGNRAAAYMKRKWDGDLYAALRDCNSALQLDCNYLKAHYRLARCLYELSWSQEAHDCLQQFKTKFPDYAKNSACEALDRDIKAAMFSKTDHDDSETSKSETSSRKKVAAISEQEKVWRDDAYDYEMRFCGHCNTTTDIKEANFFGSNGQYIVAGSDDGSFFIWERSTTNIVRVLHGDESIVNCLQPHPNYCLLATSGIDPVVRLWSPRAEDGSKNEREIDNSDDAALANQRRMNADPLEVMLMNMGYRITGVLDMEDEDDQEVGAASNSSRSDQHAHCRPS